VKRAERQAEQPAWEKQAWASVSKVCEMDDGSVSMACVTVDG
jgi:hypothetical protein